MRRKQTETGLSNKWLVDTVPLILQYFVFFLFNRDILIKSFFVVSTVSCGIMYLGSFALEICYFGWLHCIVLCWHPCYTHQPFLPAQLVFGAIVLQAEAVGLAHSFLPSAILLIRTWRDDGFPPALPAQSVRTGTEEQSEAVLLWHALQEAPQGFVAFLSVTAVVRDCCSLGAGHNILWPQGATFLVQTTVLCCLQTLVLTVHRERGR